MKRNFNSLNLETLINTEGVHVSPKKVEAILKMKAPQD